MKKSNLKIILWAFLVLGLLGSICLRLRRDNIRENRLARAILPHRGKLAKFKKVIGAESIKVETDKSTKVILLSFITIENEQMREQAVEFINDKMRPDEYIALKYTDEEKTRALVFRLIKDQDIRGNDEGRKGPAYFNLNKALVSNGYSKYYPEENKSKIYHEAFEFAEKNSREKGLGVWADDKSK